MTLPQIMRSLRRRPAFTVAAVSTMGLGLGAAMAMTAVVDAVLLRPLPYPRVERLYALSATLPGPTGQPTPFVLSVPEFVRVRSDVRTLEQAEAMAAGEMAVTIDGEPETVRGASASTGFLRVFGLAPNLGRGYSEEEDGARAPVAILDGSYWERRFARDPSVIGRRLAVDGVLREVIGVTAPGYRPLMQQVDLWIPLGARIDPARPNNRLLLGAARLAPNATEAEARAELQAVSASLAREFPQSHGRAQLMFVDLRERLYGPFRPAALLLLGGVTFLLLIACTNVANLALGRVAERRGEIALRLSIGASPSRIMREQLMEMLTVATLGAVLGAALASVALPGLLAVYPDALPRDVESSLNLRVGGLVFAQLVIAATVAGLLPARRACALPTATVLAATSVRQTGHARDRRTREWLLAAQIGFAVALLSVAALVATRLQRVSRVDPGFEPQHVITMQLAPPARYPDVASRSNFVERAIASVATVPGVIAVGTTQTTWQPLASMQTALEIDGQQETGAQRFVNVRHVTAGYFPALRVGVVEGRAFDQRDRLGAPFVAMISQSFAEQYWPGQSAIGRRVRRGASGGTTPPWVTIVGVAKDVMDSGLGAAIGPTVYLPYLQQNTVTARVTLVVRTEGDPQSLAQPIQRAVWSVDPQQPIDAVQTLENALGASIAQSRFGTLLLSTFGIIGLVLASVGVYGVSAYAAAQRTREISLRLALGATRSQMSKLLLRQTLPPVLGGLATGMVLTMWSSDYLAKRLQASESVDIVSLATASMLLSACALVANWIPLRRAARLPPMEALRRE